MSVEDLMSIGEFARRTGLSVSAIRFYASQRLLDPADVDPATGYRRYAEHQVADGILIRDLRRLEMPLSEIARALGHSESARLELVARHLQQLEATVAKAYHVARTMGAISPEQENRMSTTVASTDLAQALDQVLPVAGTDPERPHLMSVLIEGKDGSIRLVATDSYRLAIRDLVPSHLDGDFTAVVPAATLARWRSSMNAPCELSLRLDDDHLEMNDGEHDLTARLVPVAFPDYERLLAPADDVTSVVVDRDELLTALEGIESAETFTLSTPDAALLVSDGDRELRVDARRAGRSRHVTLNTGFVTNAVRHAVGAEVVVEIESPVSPVLFRSADDGTFTTRVMPVKLD